MRDQIMLTFETYQTREGRYAKTHVVVTNMYKVDTAESLEGTVDNKAGYGSMDACQRQAVRFQGMLDAGHKVHYDPTLSGLRIHIVWQHYTEGGVLDYCEPDFQHLGRAFGDIDKGMAFLKNLGRRIEKARAKARSTADVKCDPFPVSNRTFSKPEDVLTALGSIKGSLQVRRNTAFETWLPTEAKPLTAEDLAA